VRTANGGLAHHELAEVLLMAHNRAGDLLFLRA
jgi:hypothetical protein